MRTEAVEVQGSTFVCHRLGEGQRTVLLLHGFPDDPRSMHGLMRRLAAQGFSCWAPFLRGYGPSGPAPGGDYSLHALALDLLALTRALSPDEPLDLICHDWGALVGYTAAALEPGRFRRLVGMGVSPTLPMTRAIFRHPAQLHRSAYIFLFQLPWLPERLIRRRELAFIDALWRVWSPGWEAPAEHLMGVKQTLSGGDSLEQALAYYRALLVGGLLRPGALLRTLHTLTRRRIRSTLR